ncbi:hypothetical protein GCM10010440_67670 [Kitasatospora cinereorecta]
MDMAVAPVGEVVQVPPVAQVGAWGIAGRPRGYAEARIPVVERGSCHPTLLAGASGVSESGIG